MSVRIWLIEPFYSGSHKEWAEGLQSFSNHKIEILSLPGRHWKWRMEGSAIHFAEEVNNRSDKPNLLLVTDMLDVALFKSLLKGANKDIPIALYFHENQFAYPSGTTNQNEEFHFAWKNYTSSLIADGLYFNSEYNRSSFFHGIENLLKRLPDYTNKELLEPLKLKSEVLALGLNLPEFNSEKKVNSVPVILWNHRWEYDKGPDDFFNLLFKLKSKGFQFKLKVLGESYSKYPEIFDTAKRKLSEEIDFWGYASSKELYWKQLRSSDLLPVTSKHDFFGQSVAEAIHAGVFPILPNDLAYPELVDSKLFPDCFYTGLSNLESRIINFNSKENKHPSVKQFSWNHLIKEYDSCFSSLV